MSEVGDRVLKHGFENIRATQEETPFGTTTHGNNRRKGERGELRQVGFLSEGFPVMKFNTIFEIVISQEECPAIL